MNDKERDTLVYELADALMKWDSRTEPMERIDWNKTLEELYIDQVEEACMPIIERFFAGDGIMSGSTSEVKMRSTIYMFDEHATMEGEEV